MESGIRRFINRFIDMSVCSVFIVSAYFVFYLYFICILLSTWRIKPDDDDDE